MIIFGHDHGHWPMQLRAPGNQGKRPRGPMFRAVLEFKLIHLRSISYLTYPNMARFGGESLLLDCQVHAVSQPIAILCRRWNKQQFIQWKNNKLAKASAD